MEDPQIENANQELKIILEENALTIVKKELQKVEL